MQQEMDFGVFATVQANRARAKNTPPAPDRDGLFDLDGVSIICGRRQCAVEPDGDLFVDVQFKETKIRATAIASGKWDAVAILSACTRAHGNRVYAIDYAKVATNPGGLDELRIASVVGADGLRMYISKAGRDGRTWAFRTILMGFLNRDFSGSRAYASDRNISRALRALEDAGLVHIELGPRGGMATAKVTWTHRAYLAPQRLAPADEEAMEMLA